jgi:hypothetical protein
LFFCDIQRCCYFPMSAEKGVCPVPHEVRERTTFVDLAAAGGVCPVQHGRPERDVCSSERVGKASDYPAPHYDQGLKGDSDANKDWHYVYSSSIPSTENKGNSHDGSWWVGPSAHQLMRALNRKGKATGVTTDEVKVVAAVHTVVTESTWSEIMEYEELHAKYVYRRRFAGAYHVFM